MNEDPNTPSEDFSDEDAEMLVRHYGERPEESAVERIMENAEKRRADFVKKEREAKRSQPRARNR